MNVWYVSYGSNLCRDRFMCYIKGDKPVGSDKKEKGCRDKTPPMADEIILLHHPLYFAKEKSKWGKGGVAFIDHDESPRVKTVGRMYLITHEQFEDVVAQENNEDELFIHLEKVMEKGFNDINNSWYGRVLFLGKKDGAPMFTFTNPHSVENETFTTPPSAYLKTISKGLKEVGLSDAEIIDYFIQCNGIKGNFTNKSLHEYIFAEG